MFKVLVSQLVIAANLAANDRAIVAISVPYTTTAMHQMLILDLPGWLTLAARAQVSVGFPARKTMSESIAKVVFIRHGESQGNAKNVYTGWDDTPLSIKGEQEAEEAGLCLKAKGLKFDICFTSALQLLGKSGKSKLKGLSLTHTHNLTCYFSILC